MPVEFNTVIFVIEPALLFEYVYTASFPNVTFGVFVFNVTAAPFSFWTTKPYALFPILTLAALFVIVPPAPT